MAENVLHVENVTMQFGGVVAVNNLTLDVNKNEIVALIGPNGAGKTTAFNCITGVYEPTNGLVSLDGNVIIENHPQGKMVNEYKGENAGKYEKVIKKTPDQITKLGVARTFQNIRLFSNLTVFDNVLIAKHMRAKQNIFSATFRLNAKEENIIISHMWPLAKRMPRCREALVVNLADKLCATAEVLGYWRRSKVRRMAMAAA